MCVIPWASIPGGKVGILLPAGGRSGAELLAGLLHRGLVLAARLLPVVAGDRHRAGALALAVVVGAAALALAGVGAGAGVVLGGGAAALARAGVVAALALALAAVQAAAGVSVGLGRRLLLRPQQAAAQHRAGHHASEGGEGQLPEVSPADVFVQLLHFAVSSEMSIGSEPLRGLMTKASVPIRFGLRSARVYS